MFLTNLIKARLKMLVKYQHNLSLLTFHAKKLLIKMCTLIFAVVSILILPSMILITLPVIVIRFCVKRIAKLIRPDLAKILTVSSHVFATVEDLNRPKATILGRLLMSGKMDFETLFNRVENKIIKEKLPNGDLLYPELQQYMTSWFGFKFWKPDPSFDLRNHIRILKFKDGAVEKEDLRKISEQLLTKPFIKDRSPWEILLIHNVVYDDDTQGKYGQHTTDNTIMFFRYTHYLSDGYSMLKLILRLKDDDDGLDLPKINFPKISRFEQLLLPFKFLYAFAEVIMLIPMKFPWKVNGRKQTGECHVQTVEMATRDFKEVKDLYGASFTSVVYAAAAGAMRSTLLKQGRNLPDTMPCMLPIPKPSHPETLQNHFTLGNMPLPIGEPDPIKRFRLCNEFYANLKTSASPIVANFLMTLFGSYFDFIGKFFCHNDFTAVTVSYLPYVGVKDISFCGVWLIRQAFFLGLQHGSSGATILVTTWGESVSATVAVDTSVATREEVNYLAQRLTQECNSLKLQFKKTLPVSRHEKEE